MTPPAHRTPRLPPAATPLVAVVSGLLACAVAAWSTGAMEPLVFVEDAGPLVRWAVPLVRVGHDVAAAVTLGALVFAASVIPDAHPPRPAGRGDRAAGPVSVCGAPSEAPSVTHPALRLATIAGLAWTVAALAGVVLTFADAAGLPLTSNALGPQLADLVWEIDATRIGLISAGCALIVTSGAALARGSGAAAWLAALAAAGILVLGLASHTRTFDDHETLVNAMGLHLVGATMWVGGLIVLVTLHRTFAPRLAVVAGRYSTLALWSYAAVGASGVVAATTRLAVWSDLLTPYGLLLVAKAVLFVALGAAGWWHRRSTIADLDAGLPGRPFLRLAVAEVALMGAAFGIATALSRSAPPVPEDFPDPTPTLRLTGFPAPPDPGTTAWWEVWRGDWLVLGVVVVALGLYAAGVLAARVATARALVASRGVPGHAGAGRGSPGPTPAPTLADIGWPAGRAVAWVAGWLLLAWATSGPLGVYARVSLSWHLALQLVLVFVVAPLLVAGAPVTLVSRALAARTDGTLGPREIVLSVTGSRLATGLRHPIVATVLLLVTLVASSSTGMLELALTTHPGHLPMLVGSVLVGVIWSAAILTPSAALPRQALLCLAAVAVAAFVAALWLGRTSVLLAGDVLARLELPWLSDLAAEQARAGAVVLFVVVPACVVLAVVITLRPHREAPRVP